MFTAIKYCTDVGLRCEKQTYTSAHTIVKNFFRSTHQKNSELATPLKAAPRGELNKTMMKKKFQ